MPHHRLFLKLLTALKAMWQGDILYFQKMQHKDHQCTAFSLMEQTKWATIYNLIWMAQASLILYNLEAKQGPTFVSNGMADHQES